MEMYNSLLQPQSHPQCGFHIESSQGRSQYTIQYSTHTHMQTAHTDTPILENEDKEGKN